MTVVDIQSIIVSHMELLNFGTERIRRDVAPGQIVAIPIVVGSNKIRFIYEYKFGNVPIDTILFRWDTTRNVIERNLLLGTEQVNFTVHPFPFLIIKEGQGYVIVQNTGAQEAHFEMTIEYFETIKEFVERMQKLLGWKDIV